MAIYVKHNGSVKEAVPYVKYNGAVKKAISCWTKQDGELKLLWPKRFRITGTNCTISGVDSDGYVTEGSSITITANSAPSDTQAFSQWSISGSYTTERREIAAYLSPLTLTPLSDMTVSASYGTVSAAWTTSIAVISGINFVANTTPRNLCSLFNGKEPSSITVSVGAYRGTAPLATHSETAAVEGDIELGLYMGQVYMPTTDEWLSRADEIYSLIYQGNNSIFRATVTCTDGTGISTSYSLIAPV